jgi:hypothetical protein
MPFRTMSELVTYSVKGQSCRACGQEKPATGEYFYVQKNTKSGLDTVCKVCRIARVKAREQGTPLPPIPQPAATFVTCAECGDSFRVVPARIKTARFCSYACAGEWRSKNIVGEYSPVYRSGAVREKICQGCGKLIKHQTGTPLVNFERRKYCSKSCADLHGLRYIGKEHPNWKGELGRRKSRDTKHSRWSEKVLNRDHNTCIRCGASGKDTELHAHHIKPYEHYPELRYELSNGVTLCAECHWEVHQKGDDALLIVPDGLDHVRAGVRRGKQSRRWYGKCHWCGTELSKRLSDVKGREHAFCSKSCAMKHTRAFKSAKPTRAALIPDTAVPPSQTGET